MNSICHFFAVKLPLSGALLAISAAALHAQEFPTKPIRIIVPFPAGGSVDLHARYVGSKMSEFLGQPIIIDDRPGGNTHVGAMVVVTAAPDGYTLFHTLDSTITLNQALYSKIPFDPIRDFTPVARLASGNSLIAVNPSVPIHNLRELVAYARANPNKLNFGATAATTQLTGEQLRAMGAPMTHVPYKGTAQLVPAIISGEIDVVIDGHTNYVPLIRKGQLRAVALVAPGRDALLPEVPSAREQGFPEIERLGWWGLFGPANMPPSVVARLSAAALWTLKQPDFLEKQAALGLTPRPGTPEELAAQVKADIARWTPIIKAAGIKLD